MTAGTVWRRADGLTWVEIQAEAIEPSGWRVLVPMFEPTEAPEAPPLAITVARWRARTHLMTTAPSDELGVEIDHLDAEDLQRIRGAVQALIRA